MLGVFVTFRFTENFDESRLRGIAQKAEEKFKKMSGLRSKAFTINKQQKEAVNFYIWDSETAARFFFTDDTLAQITSLYGVRPDVRFVEIATLVDNAVSS